ncbi:unnamed protein product [Phytophthora fragariaefolia]|uniref:Peroxisomal trans-2-enoyl-CoA reductase n=1 Tax=Phytophthora fragariaefolia TaxID=1490495 RepID=A0A9W6XFK5_9STRA|nr:unnamed protein product [Phytophthora fragariaefolia]
MIIVTSTLRNEERLRAAADTIRRQLDAAGRDLRDVIHPIVCDIRKEEQVNNLVDETLAKYKRIDFLVNNGAGYVIAAMLFGSDANQ